VKSADMNGQENPREKLLRKKKPDLGEKCGKVTERWKNWKE